MIEDIGSCGSKEWNSACHRAWEATQKVVNTIYKDIKDIDDHSLSDLAMLLWTGSFYHRFIGDFQLDNVNQGKISPSILLAKSTSKPMRTVPSPPRLVCQPRQGR
mmetsp:Transcript_26200/g.56244  ORF Transcript_26200/g.56244 Transcript_26200/m.56244 type:complete len:105 (-) Transcript_26200:294-608(-)